jgi:serine/threonine protein kinase/Tol biopolymer transport system component
MGEVYRATDTRLNRPVAIKVLPQARSALPQVLKRFQREARAASALNHPNICTVYDIGEASDRQTFLVIELLEGETLQQRLISGALEVPLLVDTSLALADALDAAHGAGIVHRDIKPANIFLTPRGPKILDFGVAKITLPAEVTPGEVTESIVADLTDSDVAIGTVAYMSPEQLRGEPLDARTDLFSLGLVLYEMATGRRAFAGATHAVVSAAILHHAPIPPRHIRGELPARLEDIILKALEKDRAVRYQTAAELRADITRLKRDLDPDRGAHIRRDSVYAPADRVQSDSAVAPSSPVSPSSDAQMVAGLLKRHWSALTIGGVVVAVAVVAGLYTLWQRDGPLVLQLLTTSGNASTAAITSDGKQFAFAQPEGKDASVWIQQTATSSRGVPIVHPGPFLGGTYRPAATVTPDDLFVDVVRVDDDGKSALWRVPFLGGTPRRLLDDIASPVGWSPDEQFMAYVRGDGSELVVANADGSGPRVVASAGESTWFLLTNLFIPSNPLIRPAWSPDGRLIAMYGWRVVDGVLSPLIFFTSVDDELVEAVPFSSGMNGLAWLDASSLVFSGAREFGALSQLWRLSYPDGEITPWLTNDRSSYEGISVTEDRTTLVTAKTDARVGIWVGDADGTNLIEAVAPALHETNYGYGVTWAGERLLFTATNGEYPSIFSQVPGGGAPVALRARGHEIAATRDGLTLVFISTEVRSLGTIWKADADGRNAAQIAPYGILPVVTPDDRVIFMKVEPDRTRRAWMVPIEGGEPTQLTFQPTRFPDVSLDGNYLAFLGTDASNKPAIVVCDLPSCKTDTLKYLPPPPTATKLRWKPDGLGIAYHKDSNVWVQPLDGGPATQLTHFTDGRTIPDFAWSRDGKRLAVARMSFISDILLFKGLTK